MSKNLCIVGLFVLSILTAALSTTVDSAADLLFDAVVNYRGGDNPYALVTGDFNNDGHLDFVVTNSTGASPGFITYLGMGTGEIAAMYYTPLGGSPSAIAKDDFDADGNLDLAIVNSAYVSIYLGAGDGTFTFVHDSPAGTALTAISTGDFNEDGIVDLAVADNPAIGTDAVLILIGNGIGKFTLAGSAPAGDGPRSLATADINEDGHKDLIVATVGSASQGYVVLLIGDGTGAFATPPPYYSAGNNCVSVATGDFDEDGHVDMAVANIDSDDISILFKEGDTTYTAPTNYPVANEPNGVTTGDFDGDGHSDLAVAHFNAGATDVAILMGAGDGTFVSPPLAAFITGQRPVSIAAGDIHEDGIVDLLVVNSISDNVSLIRGAGGGRFVTATHFPAGGAYQHTVIAGDFNGDFRTDAAVVNTDLDQLTFLPGRYTAEFGTPIVTPGAGTGPYSLATADFNGDGNADIATANGTSDDISIYLGGGDGTFDLLSSLAGENTPYCIITGYFNADDIADLAVANAIGGTADVTVFIGNGDGTFAAGVNYETADQPHGLVSGDFDEDGIIDLAVANNQSGVRDVTILRGLAGGVFLKAADYAAGDQPQSIATGDFDEDAHLDLAVANSASNNVSILIGDGTSWFASAVDYPAGKEPHSVTVADLDADGHLDLAVANALSDDVTILLGGGDGTFIGSLSYGADYAPMSVIAADLGQSPYLNLVVGNWNRNRLSVLQRHTPLTGVNEDDLPEPTDYALSTNFPNPFNPMTTIAFELPRADFVDLGVYNVNGERIATIARGHMVKGRRELVWDARDDQGRQVASGVYFCRLVAGDFVQTKKMILLR